jgi:hypothetical protein
MLFFFFLFVAHCYGNIQMVRNRQRPYTENIMKHVLGWRRVFQQNYSHNGKLYEEFYEQNIINSSMIGDNRNVVLVKAMIMYIKNKQKTTPFRGGSRISS